METPPPPRVIPDHIFTARCQLQRCQKPVGAFHLPQVGAVVVFGCHSCGLYSVFRSTPTALESYLVDRDRRTILDKRTGRATPSTSATPPLPPVRKRDS